MHPMLEKHRLVIEELAETSRRLAELGYVTSHGGNLSVRLEDNLFAITPTKVAKRKITFDDICLVDAAGNVVHAAEGRRPTGEWPFHLRIFKNRPDLKAIVHAHPPILTGFAIAGGDWLERAFLPEPIIEVGPMVLVPYAQPLSDELAEQFDAVIHRSNGFLMENHGVVMCSPEGVERALDFLQMMEAMGISILVAQALGNAKTMTPQAVADMANVLRIRNMVIPADPRHVQSLLELYPQK